MFGKLFGKLIFPVQELLMRRNQLKNPSQLHVRSGLRRFYVSFTFLHLKNKKYIVETENPNIKVSHKHIPIY